MPNIYIQALRHGFRVIVYSGAAKRISLFSDIVEARSFASSKLGNRSGGIADYTGNRSELI